MSFLAQVDGYQRPLPPAMFVNALLCSALYHEDRRPFEAYAAIARCNLVAFVADKTTFQPDYGILTTPTDAMVIMDGTTNAAQWLAHIGSAVFPAIDPVSGNLAVGSFLLGLAVVEGTITGLVEPGTRNAVIGAGHSYGAGALNLWMQHIAIQSPPAVMFQMGFGEPRSCARKGIVVDTIYHNRITACTPDGVRTFLVSGRDPVTFTPPGILQFARFPLLPKSVLNFLGYSWQAQGTQYLFTGDLLTRPSTSQNLAELIPSADVANFALCLPNAFEHLMDSSYLAKCLNYYLASGLSPELMPLVPLAQAYIAAPFIPADDTGPPVPSATLNTAYGLPAGTVTDANRTDWSTVVAVATPLPVAQGETIMPITPYSPPTWRGTMFFDQAEGGSSESFYAAPPQVSPPPGAGAAPTTFNAMLNAMKSLATSRLAISQCLDVGVSCTNPLILQGLKVENTQVFRDGQTLSDGMPTGPSYNTTGFLGGPIQNIGQLSYENMPNNVAAFVRLSDGNGHAAQYFFHGIPVYALAASGIGFAQPPPPAAFFRSGEYLTPSWKNALFAFANRLIQLGLGFAFNYQTWTVAGQPANGQPSTGNGSPMLAFYNFPGTPQNTYTFLMSPPIAPPSPNPFAACPQGATYPYQPLGRFRVLVRGMQSLKVLNGRWPATAFTIPSPAYPVPPPAAGYYVNIRHRCANYLSATSPFYDGFGYVAPELTSVVQPAASGNFWPASPLPPGVLGVELGTKKTGKPFFEQRGRSRNRIT